ncbi:hypothetical protein EDB81DRAFT_875624 [Dactylonectria macrodidyma]|uniref:Uncharacterized protein n=1 Tax=Dactylonectria macrodidyma TaxID=307937 RepID=A0A9P9JS27_9HYPO|nr:hypothetical protein EDB81DRAFT_875624 [Dactylonectria macrodidyma]
MKLTSPLLFFASLSQTVSGFLLTSSHPKLSDHGFARIDYGNENVYPSFYKTGSYLSLTLDVTGKASSTSDLGNLLLKKVNNGNGGIWLVTTTMTSTPTAKDIQRPFSIRTGSFVYRGDGGGIWSVCGDEGTYQLYFSKKAISTTGCYSDVVLTVARF